MTTPRASVDQHRYFWAGEDGEDDRIELIAEIAANIREDAAPEPDSQDTAYDSKARGAELWVGQFIGQRGIIKGAGAGSAKVDFDTREEALSMVASMMGSYATKQSDSATGYVGTFPIARG